MYITNNYCRLPIKNNLLWLFKWTQRPRSILKSFFLFFVFFCPFRNITSEYVYSKPCDVKNVAFAVHYGKGKNKLINKPLSVCWLRLLKCNLE